MAGDKPGIDIVDLTGVFFSPFSRGAPGVSSPLSEARQRHLPRFAAPVDAARDITTAGLAAAPSPMCGHNFNDTSTGATDGRKFSGRKDAGLRQRNQTAAVAFEAAGDFEFEQHHTHHRGRAFRKPDEIVDLDGRRAQKVGDAGAFVRRRFDVVG